MIEERDAPDEEELRAIARHPTNIKLNRDLIACFARDPVLSRFFDGQARQPEIRRIEGDAGTAILEGRARQGAQGQGAGEAQGEASRIG